ncbi:hypothetical protein B5F53_02575 [Blautia sp. An249]|uniref:DUF3990 domain-containing protein n=1 Tax=Blautia sp. An249 TaxID=1965603 RepID=UPI000B57D391|nr:DUF3990 domain-containing protein [Blautia sp. An249]OUO80844.1 hypothetical protein B5F53_02575 [Blautia sp. An249]
MLTVYHGSYLPVQIPEIRKGHYTKDFGTGFYCTIIKEHFCTEEALKCLRYRGYEEVR